MALVGRNAGASQGHRFAQGRVQSLALGKDLPAPADLGRRGAGDDLDFPPGSQSVGLHRGINRNGHGVGEGVGRQHTLGGDGCVRQGGIVQRPHHVPVGQTRFGGHAGSQGHLASGSHHTGIIDGNPLGKPDKLQLHCGFLAASVGGGGRQSHGAGLARGGQGDAVIAGLIRHGALAVADLPGHLAGRIPGGRFRPQGNGRFVCIQVELQGLAGDGFLSPADGHGGDDRHHGHRQLSLGQAVDGVGHHCHRCRLGHALLGRELTGAA